MKLHNPLPESLAITCSKAASILDHFIKGTNKLDTSMIPNQVIEKAKGIAIITIVKAGCLWSGRGGTGLVVARLDDGTWSAPSAISAVGIGIGAQFGCEVTDYVLILNNQTSVKAFAQGNVTVGGNLSVATGPTGRASEAAASLLYPAPIYSYSKSKGAFVGVSLEGYTQISSYNRTLIMTRKKANKEMYGKVKAIDILSGKIPPPVHADPLYRMLNLKFATLGRASKPNPPPQDVGSSSITLSNTRTSNVERTSTLSKPAPPPVPVMSKSAKPKKATALYDFTPQQPGDLALKEGDIVWISKENGDWCEGSCRGSKGVFPTTYVAFE